jgi:hypothetical protein
MKKCYVILAFLLVAPLPAYCADYSECFEKNTMEMGFCFSDIRTVTENRGGPRFSDSVLRWIATH